MNGAGQRAFVAILLGVAAQVSAASALADLVGDLARLERAWDRAGEAETLEPQVLTHGTLVPLSLPLEATAPGPGCTTVAVLGALSTGFVLRFLPSEQSEGRSERPEPSLGGAAQLVRCGDDRQRLSRLAIEMRSPRGVLSAVVGRADRPLPSLRRILLHREPGSVAPATPPGPRPAAGDLEARIERLEDRYQRMGARRFRRRLVPPGEAGAQRILMELEPGCHRLNILGVVPASGPHGLDLDAELRWVDSGTVASVDRTDSPDAMLTTCTGSERAAVLTFAGGLPAIPVLIAHGEWSFPAGLGRDWGPEVRARIGRALWENSAQSISAPPVYESLGVSGSTLLPLELEPDACYVASVGAMQAEPKHLSLVVAHGADQAVSHTSGTDAAALTAFCAAGSGKALVEVEAHGPGVAWLLAVWQVGRTTLGGASP